MIRVNINPMSVNAAWLGRRRKTQKYKTYEEVMLSLLEDYEIPAKGDLFILYQWGLSSAAFDIDNPIKPLQDILQTRYGFNDNRLVRMFVEKEKVDKGDEYIQFLIRRKEDVDIIIYDKINKECIVNG